MLFLHSGITVGLVRTSYSTPEVGGPLSVCVEIFDGNLERNVSLTLTTSDDTAIGRTCRHAYSNIHTMTENCNCNIKPFNIPHTIIQFYDIQKGSKSPKSS